MKKILLTLILIQFCGAIQPASATVSISSSIALLDTGGGGGGSGSSNGNGIPTGNDGNSCWIGPYRC